MTNTYGSLKIKLIILRCLIRAKEPLISNVIAKRTRQRPQTIAYQLNKMVDSGILIKNDNHYKPQSYFSDKEVFAAFYTIFEPLVKYIRNETDELQMKDDNVLSILHVLIELCMEDLFK